MSEDHCFAFIFSNGMRESATRHRNPDGSVGGWVAKSARIDPTAVIEPDAVVGPDAIIEKGQVIRNGQTIMGPWLGTAEQI
jgi:UDP-3-O-[3-hydroxymyristoyl] glucosamine N-acyltransferase